MSTDNGNITGRSDLGSLARRGPPAAEDLASGGCVPTPVSFPACASECQIRQETDHRVANQLAMLAGYVRLRSAELDESGVISHRAMRLLTQSIEAQIHAVAQLHRLLVSHDSASAVDLSPLLHEMCASFRAGADQHVTLIEDFEPNCLVSTDQVLPVCQLVGEAIINALKYAFSESASGVLAVRSQRTAHDTVSIGVTDNGPGLPAGFDPARHGGFGFNLMRSVSRTLRATLNVESTARGLRIGMTLPASTARIPALSLAARAD